MAWNYRIMKKEDLDGDFLFGIHEVYYDENENVIGYSVNPTSPIGEDVEEVTKNLTMMLEALKKPLLLWEESMAVDPD